MWKHVGVNQLDTSDSPSGHDMFKEDQWIINHIITTIEVAANNVPSILMQDKEPMPTRSAEKHCAKDKYIMMQVNAAYEAQLFFCNLKNFENIEPTELACPLNLITQNQRGELRADFQDLDGS